MSNQEEPSHVVNWSKKEWDEDQRRKRKLNFEALKFSFLFIRLSILIYSIYSIFNGNQHTGGFGIGLYVVFGGWYDFYWLIKKFKKNSQNNKPKRKHNSKSSHKNSNHKKSSKSLSHKNNYKKKKISSSKKKSNSKKHKK